VITNDKYHQLAKQWLQELLRMEGENVRDRQETVLGLKIQQLESEIVRRGLVHWHEGYGIKEPKKA
jgi:hypothetical protein